MEKRELGKISNEYNKREEKIIWEDKRRILGKPISFTRYQLTETNLIVKRGIVNDVRDSMQLYRIQDVKLTVTLFQKMFGVGTIHLFTSDQTSGDTFIFNIKNPHEVMDLLTELIENEKSKRIKMTEFTSGIDHDC